MRDNCSIAGPEGLRTNDSLFSHKLQYIIAYLFEAFPIPDHMIINR